MTDKEISDRLKPILMKRLTFVDGQGSRMRRLPSPDSKGTLKSLGCEVLRTGDRVRFTNDHIFVQYLGVWLIKVPKELATKILVLGELP